MTILKLVQFKITQSAIVSNPICFLYPISRTKIIMEQTSQICIHKDVLEYCQLLQFVLVSR